MGVLCFVQLDAFYTEPLEFIKSHMPLVGRWQLTPAPVAKEDFWRDARAACDQATSVSPERTVEASSLRVLRAEKERAARARRRFPELDVFSLGIPPHKAYSSAPGSPTPSLTPLSISLAFPDAVEKQQGSSPSAWLSVTTTMHA